MIVNSCITDSNIYNNFKKIIESDFKYIFHEGKLSENINEFHKNIQNFLISEESHTNYIKENAKKLSDIILADTILYTYSILLNERSDSYLYNDIKKEFKGCNAPTRTSFLDDKQIKNFRESAFGAAFILDEKYHKKTIKAKYRFCDPILLHYFFQLDNPYYQKVTPQNLNNFFGNLYDYSGLNNDFFQPEVLAKRYMIENIFNTNIFLNCLLSIDKMGLTSKDSLTIDVISNYKYLTFLNCPELSAEFIKHFDYSEILKSAKNIVENCEKDANIKDSLFINHLDLMKKSDCFFTSRYILSILETLEGFSNTINNITTFTNSFIYGLYDLLSQKKLHELNDYTAYYTNKIKNTFIAKTETIYEFIKNQCTSINYDIADDNTVSPFAYIIPMTRIAFYNYISSIDNNYIELENYINNNKALFEFYCNKYPVNPSLFDNEKGVINSNDQTKQALNKKIIESFYQQSPLSSIDVLDDLTNNKRSSSTTTLYDVKGKLYYSKF